MAEVLADGMSQLIWPTGYYGLSIIESELPHSSYQLKHPALVSLSKVQRDKCTPDHNLLLPERKLNENSSNW